jgi:hypothetical protein
MTLAECGGYPFIAFGRSSGTGRSSGAGPAILRDDPAPPCAAALRIGRLARDLMGGEVGEVLNRINSLGRGAGRHGRGGEEHPPPVAVHRVGGPLGDGDGEADRTGPGFEAKAALLGGRASVRPVRDAIFPAPPLLARGPHPPHLARNAIAP